VIVSTNATNADSLFERREDILRKLDVGASRELRDSLEPAVPVGNAVTCSTEAEIRRLFPSSWSRVEGLEAEQAELLEDVDGAGEARVSEGWKVGETCQLGSSLKAMQSEPNSLPRKMVGRSSGSPYSLR
jgi:hypothetical protein